MGFNVGPEEIARPCVAGFGNRVDISYGTYLYSFPIQQLIMTALPKATPWLVLVLSLPASLLVGFESWHLVEKRFLRRSSKSSTSTETRLLARAKPPRV